MQLVRCGQRRGGGAILAAVAAFGAAAALLVSGVGGSTVATAIADVGALVGALIATAACARAARRSPAGRRAWALLAAATALWVLGEGIWTLYEVVLAVEVPYPSVADIGYLLGVPVAVAGLLSFTRGISGGRAARTVLDACLIGASLLLVAWVLVLGPIWHARDDDLLAFVVTVAYPVTDVVMVAVALLAMRWGQPVTRRPLQLVALALVVTALADSGFTWLSNNGTYESTNPIVLCWPAAYLLIAFAATAAGRTGGSSAPEDARVDSAAVVLLPYVPLIAAAAAIVPRVVQGRPWGPFLAANAAILVVAVLARQALTALDLHRTVVALREREGELARLALHDPLTGLANRANFSSRLERALLDGGAPAAVVYIDLDGFKAINDSHGHAVGDALLIEAARRLVACTDADMVAARLGGDEFVVLVPGGELSAAVLAERILDAFRAAFSHDGERITFHASVGVAAAGGGAGADEVVRRADAAMYVAKCAGKARAVRYPSEELVSARVGDPV